MKTSLVTFALVATAFLTGCASSPAEGYVAAPVYRTDIQSISVPIFENVTFQHGLEAELTDAIIKEVHRTTPWRVTTREGADSTLSGAITEVDMRKLGTQDRSGLVQELAVDMAVRFEWKENRTGKVLVTRRNFRAAESFVPSRGAQERLELGKRSVVDQMARDIVAELRSSW